jgi:hypothetical protein
MFRIRYMVIAFSKVHPMVLLVLLNVCSWIIDSKLHWASFPANHYNCLLFIWHIFVFSGHFDLWPQVWFEPNITIFSFWPRVKLISNNSPFVVPCKPQVTWCWRRVCSVLLLLGKVSAPIAFTWLLSWHVPHVQLNMLLYHTHVGGSIFWLFWVSFVMVYIGGLDILYMEINGIKVVSTAINLTCSQYNLYCPWCWTFVVHCE